MKFLHSPNANWIRRLLGRGARPDTRPELLGDGYYTNARNMRPTSIDGNTGAVEAIKGEEMLYPANAPNPDTYELIGSAVSQSKLMEFWANDIDCIIRIDGTIVAQSANIPYRIDRPLQLAIEERCQGGVVYPADHRSDPLFWVFNDLLAAVGTQTYFANYTTSINSVALQSPIEWPRLRALVDLTSDGLGAGQYLYGLRFRTPGGEITNPGPQSPMISVPLFSDVPAQNAYPGGRNVGGPPNAAGTATRYGVKMEFRVENPFGFSEVEIVRVRFNDGQGLTGPGIFELIARLPILPGFTPSIIFIDGQDNNIPIELIPTDEALDQWLSIRAPKSVELSDNRLIYANFEAGYQEPDLQFTEVDGATVFPITQRVVTTLTDGTVIHDGYSNAINDAYLKSHTRGEKKTWGIMGWDPVAGKFPVKKVTGAENYQMPNRRDPKTGRSFDFSSDPIYAATTACQSAALGVAPTFDAFTQGTFAKTSGAPVNVVQSAGGYEPWRPNGVGDQATGYNIKPINGRVTEFPTGDPAPTVLEDTGAIWAPMHHSLGLAINGITNIPPTMKVMTVMCSPPAGRVICQGIGTYRLQDNPVNPSLPANKSTTTFAFYSPDLFSGIVPQSVRELLEENPGEFKFQCTAPLGFYSDIYGYYRDNARIAQDPNDPEDGFVFPDMYTPRLGAPALPYVPGAESSTMSAYGIDMLSYAGVQHDEGQVNVGEVAAGGMGYQPGALSNGAPNGNYVGYGANRNPRPPNNQGPPTGGQLDYSQWHEGTNDGNFTFVPTGFTSNPLSDRGEDWILDANTFVYTPGGISTNDEVSFNSSRVRVFHQPWYVINLINDGADVPEDPTWLNTGYSIKLTSLIGEIPAGSSVVFPLVNERLDDCRPWLTTDFRYVWVTEPGQPERAWICLSNFAGASPATILNDIATLGFYTAPDGTQVYGVYEAFTQPGGPDVVSFGTYGPTGSPMPAVGSLVRVKYDDTAPWRTFGGDCTVSPAIHAVADKLSSYPTTSTVVLNSGQPGDPIKLGFLPMPYPGFRRNGNWRLPIQSSTVDDTLLVPSMSTLRQWCILWDAETRTPGRLNLIGPVGSTPAENRDSVFPNVHYVARPAEYASDITGFYPQYSVDYPGEPTDRGGVRFVPTLNLDYAKQPIPTGAGLIVGFDPRTDFCNSLAASNERDPLVEEGPGLRTFQSSDITAVSQERGEIKYIAAMLGKAGHNMYALTEKGIFRILTNKNVLTGASGEQVSTQSISNYWGEQLLFPNNIGLPGQMWRLLARGAMPTGDGYTDSIIFPNRDGFYRLTNDTLVDISDDRYMSVLAPTLATFPQDYTPQCSAFLDRVNNEYSASISPITIPANPPLTREPIVFPWRVFVYSTELGEWIGEYSYQFDGRAQVGRQTMGMRDLNTYMTDRGYIINGTVREASVAVPMVGNPGLQKELERWRVEGTRPDRIEILNQDFEVIVRQDQSIAALTNPAEAQYWVLLMDSFENWASAINIQDGVFNPTDLRPQGPFFYLRAYWNQPVESQSVALSSQLRNLP